MFFEFWFNMIKAVYYLSFLLKDLKEWWCTEDLKILEFWSKIMETSMWKFEFIRLVSKTIPKKKRKKLHLQKLLQLGFLRLWTSDCIHHSNAPKRLSDCAMSTFPTSLWCVPQLAVLAASKSRMPPKNVSQSTYNISKSSSPSRNGLSRSLYVPHTRDDRIDEVCMLGARRLLTFMQNVNHPIAVPSSEWLPVFLKRIQ